MCRENLNCLLTEKCTNEMKIRADERHKVLLEIIHAGSVPAWFEEEIRNNVKAKVIDELMEKYTRKDEDGNLYIFAWYDELNEKEWLRNV